MSITREQVADLQPGDIVELISVVHSNVRVRGELRPFPLGQHPRASITGFVGLTLGPGLVLRRADGGVAAMWTDADYSLVIISRAPRLYVNHDRAEVVAGDVAKDEDGKVWHAIGNSAYGELRWWGWNTGNGKWMHVGPKWPDRLRLLVDGETGEVVQ